jgi:aspartyl-tRNA(Asn)/glutamyl-tRNA(Gln) amidotransferase subunit C
MLFPFYAEILDRIARMDDHRKKIKVDPKMIRAMAKLARLEIRDDEIPVLMQEFNRILEIFDTLNSVDTSNAIPLMQISPFSLRIRKDMPLRSFTPNEALKASPRRDGNFINVPRVIDSGEGH